MNLPNERAVSSGADHISMCKLDSIGDSAS